MFKIIKALCLLIIIFTSGCSAQENISNKKDTEDAKPRIGAYYFDGWTGKTSHIKPALENFLDRKPVWGSYITSTPELVQTQINLAADAGLDFFSFCWYFDSKDFSDNLPINNALKLYLKSANRSRLKFNIMVANHQGFYINPSNWNKIKHYWLALAKEKEYLTVNQKPLIVFFEFREMMKNFGSEAALKKAIDDLKNEAIAGGLKGLTVGVCVWPGQNNFQQITDCGFDLITGYNYHGSGLTELVNPIANMAKAEYNVWNQLGNKQLPYIPVSTLNWDMRPWSDTADREKRFVGFGEKSVEHSVGNLKTWLMENSSFAAKEKLGILYAWNEYGEGGWLTPSVQLKDSLLNGLKNALR